MDHFILSQNKILEVEKLTIGDRLLAKIVSGIATYNGESWTMKHLFLPDIFCIYQLSSNTFFRLQITKNKDSDAGCRQNLDYLKK